MALILVRGDNSSKLLNAIADIERHAQLHLIDSPQKIDAEFADSIVESILKAPLRNKSKAATAFFVKEDNTFAIMQVKKIRPPAHVIVVSDEYDEFKQLNNKLNISPPFKGYYTSKSVKNTERKDYKLK